LGCRGFLEILPRNRSAESEEKGCIWELTAKRQLKTGKYGVLYVFEVFNVFLV